MRPVIFRTLTAFLSIAVAIPADSRAFAQARQVTQYDIEAFLGTTNYRGGSFSPANDKLLVSSDQTGIYNAYSLQVQGGRPTQLTHSDDDAIFALSYFPDDERFLYSSDQGGNELDHLYLRDLDGSVRDLTPGDSLKAQFLGWTQDDGAFLVGTTERDPRFFDVYLYDVDSFERTMIYQNDEGLDFAALSPDRRYLAVSKVVTNADTDIYLFDRETNETTLLTDDDEPVSNSAQTFSPDGQYLYYLTDKDNEFQYLVRYDLATGARETVEQVEWDIWYAYFSKRGKYLVVGINADAQTELRIYDARTMERVALPDMGDADITSVRISRDETRMAFYASNARQPGDLFVLHLDESRPPAQLTRSLNANIDPDHLVEGQVARFESYDGIDIPGVLYKPHHAGADSKVPAIVWVHGGPGGQSRIGYSALLQYLVNHGYAVYAINNRGSSGYGKTFYHLDDRKHGDADLDDVVESKKMLGATGWVDVNRIGILGGSYGGYMVLAALSFRPDAFEAGVDLFGISNWHRTVTNIPPWWESFRAALEQEMGAFDDEEFFKAKSPLFHADRIVKPLMVLQGANDPRVLKVESDEIVEAVRANGVPVEYIVFPDEGHGFVKKANQATGYAAILQFLNKHLRGQTTQVSP